MLNMATVNENDYPSNEESGDDSDSTTILNPKQESDDERELPSSTSNNIAQILKQLQSTGALKKPKSEFYCKNCKDGFLDSDEFNSHLIEHASVDQAIVLLDKLSDENSTTAQSGDENWSDEETQETPQLEVKKPQKVDISQILKKTGLSIKASPTKPVTTASNALNKLSGLGFTITKNASPIKQEKVEPESNNSNNDLVKKLGQLGGIKLKLKSEGNNSNSFKVVNGLKEFKAFDDDDEENEEDSKSDIHEDDSDEYKEKSAEHDKFDEESDNEDSLNKNTEREDNLPSKPANTQKVPNIPGIKITPKVETMTILKITPPNKPETIANKSARPPVKQTPRRGSILKAQSQPSVQEKSLPPRVVTPPQNNKNSASSANQRRPTVESNDVSNVVIKQEIDNDAPTQQLQSILSGQIKTERTTPPPQSTFPSSSTPTMTNIKTETEIEPVPVKNATQPLFSNNSTPQTEPLLPVTKQEDTGITIIEINGDSNDEDDDCCVVSATPAPDVKPVVPKTEPTYVPPPPVTYPSSQTSLNSSSQPILSRLMETSPAVSTEKQHYFNWNAPDTKPIDTVEKSVDDMFDSLFSSTKNENLSDASEFVSLDTLGPQHNCDICNTRFTNISMLEDHIRTTGHSKSIVTPTSSLLPYSTSSNSLISSLFPVKQLAEQVGKLSTISGPGASGFTHQQNVMINIQAYPGSGGMMMPPQPYNNYGPSQTMPPGYQGSNVYGASGQQPQPGQGYPPYMGQSGYGHTPHQSPMSAPGYTPQTTTFPSVPGQPPYSSASPLHSMQQAVYGHTSPGMGAAPLGQQIGQMGPPSQPSPGSIYVPTSAPGMKPPSTSGSNIKIQNVQTFMPGQLGAPIGGAGPPGSPSQIRPNNPGSGGPRPRMAGIRSGSRPSIRPGIQVQGQTVRGGKPPGLTRMPMKRPNMAGGPPAQKRRPDMLLPGKHDNEDCHVMSMQKQRDGFPLIQSVQGAKDKVNLGSQISVTKKTVNKQANAMANVLASRGIMVKQKQKSRSPSPERPLPYIPNLGAGVSIKHMSKSSSFSIPEAKVGGGMYSCKICRKSFMNQNSYASHMSSAHPQSKIPMFKCDECPASYPKSLQLQHHKRVFHNVTGPNRELGLPVIDISQEENLKKLSNVGIYSFIPLATKDQSNGCFGIPVISVNSANNGLMYSLQGLGADGLLSLGPLKPLPNH